jgi:ribonuclease R
MEREKVCGVTIDAAESRDLDDAVWIAPGAGGRAFVQVHISDVASLVPKGHDFDAPAMERAATVYRPRWSAPMLPPGLADVAASLRPGAARPTITIEMEVDGAGFPQGPRIYPSEFTSLGRLTYEAVPAILGGVGARHEAVDALRAMEACARRWLGRRRDRGALALYDLNNGWVATEEGHIKRIEAVDATIGYVIVQEMMIAANAAVACWCAERDVPILFRNHTARAAAPPRAEILEQLALAQGEAAIDVVTLREFVHLALNRADYGPALRGHYGLNLPAYAHCTSPIRRYADLVVQRQIAAVARGEVPPHSRDELEAIAASVNATLAARREREDAARSEREKARVDGRAEAALGRGSLRGLDDARFERVVKVAVRSGAEPPCGARGGGRAPPRGVNGTPAAASLPPPPRVAAWIGGVGQGAGTGRAVDARPPARSAERGERRGEPRRLAGAPVRHGAGRGAQCV